MAGNTFYNVANFPKMGDIKTTLLEANCYFENFLLNISQADVSEVKDYIGQQAVKALIKQGLSLDWH